MKTYFLASLAILLACCYVGSAFAADSGAGEVEMLVFPDAYSAGSVSNGGTISGVVKFEGDMPEMKVLEITKDQAVCGATEKYDESVVVGEGNALKNTIVYLIDVSKGKDFDKATKLEMDQKGCKFTPHVQIVPVGTRLTSSIPIKLITTFISSVVSTSRLTNSRRKTAGKCPLLV